MKVTCTCLKHDVAIDAAHVELQVAKDGEVRDVRVNEGIAQCPGFQAAEDAFVRTGPADDAYDAWYEANLCEQHWVLKIEGEIRVCR